MGRFGKFPLLLVTGVALAVAGCGGDKSSGDATTDAPVTTTQATTPATAGTQVSVGMGEFYFKPQDVTVAAGKVEVTARNVGKVMHELIVVRTDAAPDSFTAQAGRVDEEKLGDVVGEIADVEAGDAKSKTFDLPAGTYVMICNIAGHYQAGMYGAITAE